MGCEASKSANVLEPQLTTKTLLQVPATEGKTVRSRSAMDVELYDKPDIEDGSIIEESKAGTVAAPVHDPISDGTVAVVAAKPVTVDETEGLGSSTMDAESYKKHEVPDEENKDETVAVPAHLNAAVAAKPVTVDETEGLGSSTIDAESYEKHEFPDEENKAETVAVPAHQPVSDGTVLEEGEVSVAASTPVTQTVATRPSFDTCLCTAGLQTLLAENTQWIRNRLHTAEEKTPEVPDALNICMEPPTNDPAPTGSEGIHENKTESPIAQAPDTETAVAKLAKGVEFDDPAPPGSAGIEENKTESPIAQAPDTETDAKFAKETEFEDPAATTSAAQEVVEESLIHNPIAEGTAVEAVAMEAAAANAVIEDKTLKLEDPTATAAAAQELARESTTTSEPVSDVAALEESECEVAVAPAPITQTVATVPATEDKTTEPDNSTAGAELCEITMAPANNDIAVGTVIDESKDVLDTAATPTTEVPQAKLAKEDETVADSSVAEAAGMHKVPEHPALTCKANLGKMLIASAYEESLADPGVDEAATEVPTTEAYFAGALESEMQDS